MPSPGDLKAVGEGCGTTTSEFSEGKHTQSKLITQGWTGREAAFSKTPGYVPGAC